MARRTILVIDDDKDIHAVFRALLQREGDLLLSAMDPIQGLALARKPGVEAIVLDIQMPGGGGYAAYKRLTTIAQTMSIPILVYSAVPEAEVRRQIPDLPPASFVAKPAAPDAILAALNGLLGV